MYYESAIALVVSHSCISPRIVTAVEGGMSPNAVLSAICRVVMESEPSLLELVSAAGKELARSLKILSLAFGFDTHHCNGSMRAEE